MSFLVSMQGGQRGLWERVWFRTPANIEHKIGSCVQSLIFASLRLLIWRYVALAKCAWYPYILYTIFERKGTRFTYLV